MIIDTADFLSLPGITQATLSESADSPSVLNLAWTGYGPDWLRWMEPVTVIHRGRVLFHGRMNAFERTNAAGDMESRATVVNALWLLDNLPLGAQVAEAKAATATSAADFSSAAQNALMSWTALAKSCRVSAPLWVVSADGVPQEDGIITLDVSGANYSTGAVYKRDKVMTAWTALLEMKQANPDASFRLNYTTGKVEVVSIGSAAVADWSTDDMQLTACASIAPQYESCITGVALVVSWQGAEGAGCGSVVRVYPDGVTAGDMGVKLYSATVENHEQAEEQADYMMRQLRRYYEAVNVLQYGGSVTALLEDVSLSPLCSRLNIVGTGTHETWHSMAAFVSGVEWDFLNGTVDVQLGAQIDEPDISEMIFPDEESDDSTDDFSSDELLPDDFSSDDDSTTTYPEDLTTWDFTTTWDPEESWSEESTTTWDFTTTWDDSTTCEFTTTWDDITAWTSSEGETETVSVSVSGSETPPGGSDTPPQPPPGEPGSMTTQTGSATATGSGCGCDCPERWKQLEIWKQEIIKKIDELPQPGEACECAEKWSQLEEWKSAVEQRLDSLERRVSALEQGGGEGAGTGTCGCECGGLLEAIMTAVRQAAAGVSLSATVTQSVMPTNTGNLQVTAKAGAAGGSGESSVSFHY